VKNESGPIEESNEPPGKAPERGPESERLETVGRLAGAVAHDFANILTLIAGYSDMLLNRIGERDPLRPELDEIRKAANRGARLTAQLLGFTRGQAVQPRELDLNSILCDTERMLQLIAGECVDLQLDLCPALHTIMADPGQMEQVILNLVLNARDAISAGGQIRIETANGEVGESGSCENGVRPGPCITLSITDNGHGISPETMSHIFEPFFTTKEHGKGTGLGLSTVHRIVKESGGDIQVSSAPGSGATFRVRLPQAQTEVRRADAADTPAKAAAGCETLLVVEDEDGVRRLLTHVLHRQGYTVLEAANGEEALEIFERRADEIDLVLTDLVMPRMGGRQLGELLLRLRPGLKIVYMSGYTDDLLFRTGALSPGMPFLQKPLRPEVLGAKIRETLDAVGCAHNATN
jgi:CheY-like chemotaxis protein